MTNHDEPEEVDLRSLDIAEEKRQELLRVFPEVRTEGAKIDFDRLKEALGETVDVGKSVMASPGPVRPASTWDLGVSRV